MKHAPLLALVAASLAATQATAQSQGLYARGFAEIEYIDVGTSNETGYYTDFTVGIDPDGIGSPWPLGAEVSVEAFDFDGTNEEVLFATAFYDTGYGRWSLGIPRPVVDDYVTKTALGRNNILDNVVLGAATMSATKLLQYLGDEEAFGLRYDGTFGNANLGVSIHDFDDADAQAYHAAVGFDLGQFNAALGVEYVDGPGVSETGTYGSVGSSFGNAHVDLWAGNGIFLDETGVQLTLGYDVLPTLLVEASYFDISGADLDAWAIGAEWTFWRNAYLGASYVDTDVTGDDGIYDVSLGWKLDY